MAAFLSAHSVLLLSLALGLSELLAFAVPSAGGIVAVIVSLLKGLGAQQPPQ
jgi:hypothetical protein